MPNIEDIPTLTDFPAVGMNRIKKKEEIITQTNKEGSILNILFFMKVLNDL